MQPGLIIEFTSVAFAVLAVVALACAVSRQRGDKEVTQPIPGRWWSRRYSSTVFTNVLLFRVGLAMLFLALVVQSSRGLLRERATESAQGIPRVQSEASVEPPRAGKAEGERLTVGTEQIIEQFREQRSAVRTYFSHVVLTVRVPYPKDWVMYIEQNNEQEFRVRFYPRESEAVGYSLRRLRQTKEEFEHGIRDADFSRVTRSGIMMERVRVPPLRNPFDESSAPLPWWVHYVWQDGMWQYVFSGAEDDPFFEAAATLLKFPDTVVPTADSGVIEGSLSYPSEVVLPQRVCATNVLTQQQFCTDEQVHDDLRYAYGVGYRLQVPAGTYVVVSRGKGNVYEARYLGCAIPEECSANAPVPVTVPAGVVVSGIDPQEWIPSEENPKDMR